MNNRCLHLKRIAVGSVSATLGLALQSAEKFADQHRQEILHLTPDSMVSVQLNPEWHSVMGKPNGNWMTRMPTKSAVRFRLTANFNLDTLSQEPKKLNDEIVLYNQFSSQTDGISQLGIGADYWFEAWVNGSFCESTFDIGNSSQDISPENQVFYIPVKKGENLLAVRVRRGSAADWKFTAGRVPYRICPYPAVLHGPWLTHPDSDSISIRFFTAGKIAAGVEYRKIGDSRWDTAWDHAHGQIQRREFHAVHLSGLKGETHYEYRIVMLDPEGLRRQKFQQVYSGHIGRFFVPGEKKSDLSFFFTADLQFPFEKQRKILRSLFRAADAGSCDFIVLGGDIGMAFSMKQMTEIFFPEIAGLADHLIPLVMIRGNHELRGEESELFPEYFAGPNGLTYGIFRWGETAFLLIDCFSDTLPRMKWCSLRDMPSVFFDGQKNVLESLLRSKKWEEAKRRIVISHSAPYSHPDKGNFITRNLKNMADPWFAGKNPRFKIDLWLAGHVHHYLRSIPGSAEIASLQNPAKPVADGTNYTFPVLTVAGPNKFGYLEASAFRIDTDQNKLKIRAFAPNGKCFEELELEQSGKMKEKISVPHYKL